MKNGPSDASRQVREIILRTSKSLEHRYHIKPFGDLVGMPNNMVEVVGIDFQVLGPLTQEELRPILVDATNELLTMINSNEKLRPHLMHYPFLPSDIEIVLFVVDRNGHPPSRPNIMIADSRRGELTYSSDSPTGKGPFTQIAQESFEAAAKIVGDQSGRLEE